MTKLMYAVWGRDLSSALRDPGLHAGLHGAGVERLQLNLDDEGVAGAMRIASAGAHVSAVVSAWGDDPQADRITGCLAAVDGVERVDGWRVEERRRLDPPEVWDGSRVDALAQVALLRRPEGLSYEEWLHIWQVDHTGVAIRTQATFGYVQNIVRSTLTARGDDVAALVEELFVPAAIHDRHAFHGSGGDEAELARRSRALMASVRRMGADRGIDVVPTGRRLYDLRDL
ncbi:hypothetical protein GHK92_09235 [Nocardioides sp. dk4132]|uniref:hypothetical protein n=1 Tax=unclassified Nocardioides TaxID=2615069 RepID=UPI001295A30A|nr:MULTISPECIES: hypothetical protein [unclassified Nocardioides]MQW76057.1 hypothetical protein [Nocardioides sp. dk4132]QGA08907.1 hypothetical protein GFH29_16995 [Nocardioides sp. dk884]